MADPLVVAGHLARTYEQGATPLVAVADATCTVQPGDRIALVGPSGSGKTTLLHLLGGLDTPTGGTLTWPALGPAATLRPAHIALVFQRPSLLPPLNVSENVALPLLLGGMAPAVAHNAAVAILTQLDLADLATRLPSELSGGQAQRVAVARALATRPALILADEPTGQLDQATAAHLLDELLAALHDSPVALVIATHDPAVAARMTHVWQMAHGVLAVTS